MFPSSYYLGYEVWGGGGGGVDNSYLSWRTKPTDESRWRHHAENLDRTPRGTGKMTQLTASPATQERASCHLERGISTSKSNCQFPTCNRSPTNSIYIQVNLWEEHCPALQMIQGVLEVWVEVTMAKLHKFRRATQGKLRALVPRYVQCSNWYFTLPVSTQHTSLSSPSHSTQGQ